jgi:SAM-dependent methyltransferase
MKPSQDAFGHQLFDYLEGTNRCEAMERDDGYLEVTDSVGMYFQEYDDWPESHKQAMELVEGRVLDVGCGAGRHAIYLQKRGHAVTGIDVSPLAIKVSRQRGLKDARVLSSTGITSRLGRFDTIIMLSNGFGIFGSPRRARWLLRRMLSVTTADAKIIVEAADPNLTQNPVHRRYHRRNRELARPTGQVRVRIRYRAYATPWFDWLLVSRAELRGIVEDTGWRIERVMDADGPLYIVILRKAHR